MNSYVFNKEYRVGRKLMRIRGDINPITWEIIEKKIPKNGTLLVVVQNIKGYKWPKRKVIFDIYFDRYKFVD